MNSAKVSDVVEIVPFETETSSKIPTLETSKFLHFAEISFKNVVITSKLNVFQISGIFPTCFGCSFPAKTTNKKSLNYRNCTIQFLSNILSLETCSLRDRDET